MTTALYWVGVVALLVMVVTAPMAARMVWKQNRALSVALVALGFVAACQVAISVITSIA